MQQQQHFHPILEYQTGHWNTLSGKIVDLNNPSEDMIDIRDIVENPVMLTRQIRCKMTTLS